MAKFNEVQKKMRAQKAERKRAIHGDPITGKLKVKPQKHSISGKRKRKLMQKSNRDQKEAAAKGLMMDVQMADFDNERSGHKKLSMKKAVKLKKLNRKGKSKAKSAPKLKDAMVE